MRYLLDVNALIALGINQHQFHARIARWAHVATGSVFLTCSITEIGFTRVVAQAPIYSLDVLQAKRILRGLKKTMPLELIADANDINSLPAWVNRPAQTTDGHLLELAKSHNAILATFDRSIAGAYLIP